MPHVSEKPTRQVDRLHLQMANKPAPWVLPKPIPVLTGIPALTGFGYEYVEFPTFSIGYRDIHIHAIIPVPV